MTADRAAARTLVKSAVVDMARILRAQYAGYVPLAQFLKTVPLLSPRPWTALESTFYRALRLALEAEALKLATDIGEHGPGFIDQPSYWAEQRPALINAVSDSLAGIAELGAQAGHQMFLDANGGLPVSVNWNLANTNAGDWARVHAGELVQRIEPTTREAVQQAVADWTASGESVAQLADRIRDLSGPAGGAFSPNRARLIAQTEATNAYAAGNVIAWTAAGVVPPVLRPGAHPGCRCRIQPVRLPDDTMGTIWLTAEDERVCDQRLVTPWDPEIEGCQELDHMVVSAGAYLGQKLP